MVCNPPLHYIKTGNICIITCMPEYQRIYQPGGTYFFTLVADKWQKIFALPETRALFSTCVQHVRRYHPFTIEAFCILPDHIHMLWRLPENDADYSMRISQIKRRFSRRYTTKNGSSTPTSESRIKRRELTIWQRRFWEHLIRDKDDLHRHIDYIHYNPIKHGWVKRVRDWEDSSFHDYVKAECYELNWGDEYDIDEKRYNFGE